MGMPINSYTLLKSFTDGSKVLKKAEAVEALKPFNMYAFIIHDPKQHIDFHHHIAENFQMLDSTTGKKLLFFALTDPPQEWFDYTYNRPYRQAFDSFATNELQSKRNSIDSRNPGLTAYTLANQLTIPYEDLPCLVVTTNFRKQDFLWFKTCSRHINDQLGLLGFLSTMIEKRNPDYNRMSFTEKSESFFKLIKEYKNKIDLCGGQGEITLNSSLAKALTDCLSFVVASGDGSQDAINEAKSQALTSLGDLNNNLIRLKSEKNIDDELLDDLCLKINLFRSQLIKVQPKLIINETLFEKDSYIILETAITIHNYFNTHPEKDYDHTPSIICLSKVFEKEINLSMVHWIRRNLGIDLPNYFNKYQKGKTAKMKPNFPDAYNIDFNQKRNGNWVAPGIGQSRLCWEELILGTEPEGWDDETLKVLQEKWTMIGALRNKAAHTEKMNREQANEMYQHITSLLNGGYFDLISQTKESFMPS
jgi:hypothetical protein